MTRRMSSRSAVSDFSSSVSAVASASASSASVASASAAGGLLGGSASVGLDGLLGGGRPRPRARRPRRPRSAGGLASAAGRGLLGAGALGLGRRLGLRVGDRRWRASAGPSSWARASPWGRATRSRPRARRRSGAPTRRARPGSRGRRRRRPSPARRREDVDARRCCGSERASTEPRSPSTTSSGPHLRGRRGPGAGTRRPPWWTGRPSRSASRTAAEPRSTWARSAARNACWRTLRLTLPP